MLLATLRLRPNPTVWATFCSYGPQIHLPQCGGYYTRLEHCLQLWFVYLQCNSSDGAILTSTSHRSKAVGTGGARFTLPATDVRLTLTLATICVTDRALWPSDITFTACSICKYIEHCYSQHPYIVTHNTRTLLLTARMFHFNDLNKWSTYSILSHAIEVGAITFQECVTIFSH